MLGIDFFGGGDVHRYRRQKLDGVTGAGTNRMWLMASLSLSSPGVPVIVNRNVVVPESWSTTGEPKLSTNGVYRWLYRCIGQID